MVDSAIFKDALEKILAFCHTMLKLKCPIFVQKSDFDSKSAKNLIKIWTFGRVCVCKCKFRQTYTFLEMYRSADDQKFISSRP